MTKEVQGYIVLGCILSALLAGAWFIAEWDRANPRPAPPRPYMALGVVEHTLKEAQLDLIAHMHLRTRAKDVEGLRLLRDAANNASRASMMVGGCVEMDKKRAEERMARRKKSGNDAE